MRSQTKKTVFLMTILLLYIALAILFKVLALNGIIQTLPPYIVKMDRKDSDLSLDSPPDTGLAPAKEFFEKRLVRANKHIDLYYLQEDKEYPEDIINDKDNTNSEAMSYYLLWNAQGRNKRDFDAALDFLEEHMLNEEHDYLMWKLDKNDISSGNNKNIASDADLRVIHALYLAKEQWTDKKDQKRYGELIERLKGGLEQMVITKDNHFAPYGGVRDGEIWKTEEVWLSYSDFEVFRKLSYDHGQPWTDVYDNMKKAVLKGRRENGLFMTQLTEEREYHNTLDGGNYSINSLWVMVRSAESRDPELENAAKRSLEFYKKKYYMDGKLYTSYNEKGVPQTDYESPWVYALVLRASINLEDEEFSKLLQKRLNSFQVREKTNNSELYGSYPEGDPLYVSQFTMQEIILTLQDARNKRIFSLFG